jgi:general nucleoside transport system ATP-binding protein
MSDAVEMFHVTKRFGGVVANREVDLRIAEGEIHGLIGENGAGKSTLMNVLYGLLRPDQGRIRLLGRDVDIQSPHMAIQAGVGMVHQHFMLMPDLTVLQNVILGRTPERWGLIDERTARLRIERIMEQHDLPIDLDARVYQLSVGEKQRVEIVKALFREVRVLILDEPTAVLTPIETVRLLKVLRGLKAQGKTMVFITHKLREVMAITDTVTVMRRGVVTGRVETARTDPHELATMMVGREVDLDIPRQPFQPGEPVLRVSGLHARNARGLPALRGVSFEVRRGEIVGIAGVEGNGQTELIEVVTGMSRPTVGTVELLGRDVTRASVRQRREAGMAHIPEDRLKVGVAAACTIRDNLILNRYYRRPYRRLRLLDNRRLGALAEDLCRRFLVKTPDAEMPLSSLSGGNMQKVVFAREMEVDPELLIAAQPTRGVDVGAIEYLHTRIVEARDQGKSVLLVSAELDEILSLSDRVLVMYEGELVAELPREGLDEGQIGPYMVGANRQERRIAG